MASLLNSVLNLYSNYIISYHVRNCPDIDSIAVLVFVDIFKVQITTLILSEVEPWAVIVSAIGSIMISWYQNIRIERWCRFCRTRSSLSIQSGHFLVFLILWLPRSLFPDLTHIILLPWSVVGSIRRWLSSRISPYQIMGAIYQRQEDTSRVGSKTQPSLYRARIFAARNFVRFLESPVHPYWGDAWVLKCSGRQKCSL